MPMTSLNISLPEPLKEYVERQVASGGWPRLSFRGARKVPQVRARPLGANLEGGPLKPGFGLSGAVRGLDDRRAAHI
jgi:hypothetical protein